jgi:hypothetical protein
LESELERLSRSGDESGDPTKKDILLFVETRFNPTEDFHFELVPQFDGSTQFAIHDSHCCIPHKGHLSYSSQSRPVRPINQCGKGLLHVILQLDKDDNIVQQRYPPFNIFFIVTLRSSMTITDFNEFKRILGRGGHGVIASCIRTL